MTGPIKAGSVPQGGAHNWPRVIAVGVTDSEWAAATHRALIGGYTSISEWGAALLRRELSTPLDRID